MVWKRDKKQGSEPVDDGVDAVEAQADLGDGSETMTLDTTIDAPPVAEAEQAPADETPVDDTRRLNERIRTLGIQLDTARVREDELTGQVVELEGGIQDLRTHASDLETRVDELGSLTGEIDTITDALDKERRRASGLAEARSGLEEEANRLSSQVAQLTDLIDEAKADAVVEATRATAAENRLADMRESHDRLGREHDEARDEAQTATHRLQTRLDELTAEVDEVREALVSAEARAHDHERALEKSRAELQERDGELGRLRDAVASMEARLEEGRKALAARETQLEGQQEAMQDIADEAERRVVEAREAVTHELEAAEAALVASERQTTEAQQAAAQADELVVEAEARAAQVEERAIEAEQAAASAGSQLGATRAALSNLEGAHETLRMRTVDLKSEVERHVESARELEDRIAVASTAEGEVERLTAELEQVRTDLETATTDAAAASVAQSTEDDRAAATARIAELEAAIDELRGEAARENTSELDELRTQFVDSQAELGRATEELSAVRADMDGLEKQLEAARANQESSQSDMVTELRLARDDARNEVERLRDQVAEIESGTGEDRTPDPAGGDSDEIRGEIADLELRLGQAEMRARRAYSAAEAAEAALAYEKERRMSLAPTVEAEAESSVLRQRIGELLDRVSAAEEAARKAEADLAAVRAGVEPQEAGEEINPATSGDDVSSDEDASGRSLRAQLAGAVSSRRSGSSGDANQWR